MHIKFQPEKKINLPIRFVRVNNKILKHLLWRFFFFYYLRPLCYEYWVTTKIITRLRSTVTLIIAFLITVSVTIFEMENHRRFFDCFNINLLLNYKSRIRYRWKYVQLQFIEIPNYGLVLLTSYFCTKCPLSPLIP